VLDAGGWIMTRDEAMKVFRDAISAGQALAPFAGEEAAATVIQQALAEREVGMIEALKPFAHYYRLNDCEGRPDDDAIEVPIGDLRFAALALAAKGDSRG
jgi:hypothetical protein